MIKSISTLICVFVCANVTAQVQPPDYAVGTKVNSVRTWDVQKPLTNDTLVSTSADLKEVIQTTQYLDGLGRPLQTVARGTSPLGKDMVAPVVYDAFGREQYKFLPYASSAATDGSFKPTLFTDQKNFYNDANTNSPINGQGKTYYYGQNIFEPSPLNRVMETQAPGNSWIGNNRGVKTKYVFNAAIDAVKIWTVTNNAVTGNFGTYAVSSTNPNYSNGELYKTIAIDENGNQVIEFKDREGKIILKKVQHTATGDNGAGADYIGWLSTYYIYDDLNNLRCVMQPEGVSTTSSDWVIKPDILNEQCFRYEYDARNRMIMKKVPGAAPVNMVYDALDRLVMTQDDNMANAPAKWMITKYDALNRPSETGLLTDANNAAYHQNLASQSSNYPGTTSNYELLTQTYYDNYAWFAASGSPFTTATIATSETNGFLTPTNTVYPYPQPNNVAQTSNTGLVTGSKVKVLGTADQYFYTVTFYDDKDRPLQIRSTNITGEIDKNTNQYSFDGKLLMNKQTVNYNPGIFQQHILVTKNTYTPAGRLSSIQKNIDNTGFKTTVSDSYDELGQLDTKTLGPTGGTQSANLTYDYNIRGWLLGLNRSYVLTTNVPSGRKFGYQLGYDKLTNTTGRNFTAAQYNGNIAGVVWKSSGDGIRRKYDFSYDPVNRLMKADFVQNNNGTTNWDNSIVDYTVKMGADGVDLISAYTWNGNIRRMQQWGLEITGSTKIDDLYYDYFILNSFITSNKIKSVTELGGPADHKLGDFTDKNTVGADYGYDLNGNLISDLNKKMVGSTGLDLTSGGAITYNYLNLPQQISMKQDDGNTSKGTITYTYDAAGSKLKKSTVDQSASGKTITTATTYLGSFVYESKTTLPADANNPDYTGALQFVSHEEGRIRYKPADSTYAFDYFIKDHLGNVRMVLTDETLINAYPASTLEGTYNAQGTTQLNSMVNYEKQFYNIDATKITAESAIPSWVSPAETVANTKLYYNNNGNPPANTSYPAGCTPAQTAGSNNFYKLNPLTGGKTTGLEFMIKVMAGDHIDIFGKSYYLNTASITNSNSTTLDIASLFTNLLLSPSNAASAKGITAPQHMINKPEGLYK